MSDDIFEQGQDETEQQIGMVTPARVLNQVEHALLNAKYEAHVVEDIGIPFIDAEDGALENADDYPGFTLAEVLAVRDAISADVARKFGRQLALARALGVKGTLQEYVELCEQMNVDPIVRSLS